MALPPIDMLEERRGTRGDPDEKGYELVTGRMQDAPSVLGGARALPLIG